MTKSAIDLITIVRNVTGRLDASDPMFTNQIILGFINDFMLLEMGQEMRITENQTWWDFTIAPESDGTFLNVPVDLQNPISGGGKQFTTIGPLVYIDGFRAWWWQDPSGFYYKWPDTQTYDPSRPTDVLYYNNELVFRAPANQLYNVRINAYAVEVALSEENPNISEDYLWRYVAYGASRDIFSDFGEMDQWDRYERAFMRYKTLVYARTYQQNMSQRSIPRF